MPELDGEPKSPHSDSESDQDEPMCKEEADKVKMENSVDSAFDSPCHEVTSKWDRKYDHETEKDWELKAEMPFAKPWEGEGIMSCEKDDPERKELEAANKFVIKNGCCRECMKAFSK